MDEFTTLENEYWHNIAVKIPKLQEEVQNTLKIPMMRATLGAFLVKLENSPEAKRLIEELESLYTRQIAVRQRLTEIEQQRQDKDRAPGRKKG